ncbi:MAG: hypothetical protein V1787_03275 [Candidatus Micrarchaeota archaeon]
MGEGAKDSMGTSAAAVVEKVREHGRLIFIREPGLLSSMLEAYDEEAFVSLVDGLNIPDTGMKQPCTVLAILLKLGRKNPQKSLALLDAADVANRAPKKYLRELTEKIGRYSQKVGAPP